MGRETFHVICCVKRVSTGAGFQDLAFGAELNCKAEV